MGHAPRAVRVLEVASLAGEKAPDLSARGVSHNSSRHGVHGCRDAQRRILHARRAQHEGALVLQRRLDTIYSVQTDPQQAKRHNVFEIN